MKKKYSIEELEKNSNQFSEDNSRDSKAKTPVIFSKKRGKKKKTKRIIISSILVIVLGTIGYFGWISYNAMKNVFNGEAPSLLNLFDKKQLKGEADGRINVLLMGKGDVGHAGQELTDTMMVVSLDPKTKDVAMVSVPRDLYVKIDGYGYGKINAANAYGEQYKYSGGGAELARQTIAKVVGVPIHYYAVVDFTGFKKIIDAVGGIDVDVEKDLYDPLFPKDNEKGVTTFSITKGTHHLDGTTALKYARSRETTSDFDRAKRQQQVILATKNKVLNLQTLSNPKKVAEIIQVLGDHIKTDMQLSEAQRLYDLAKNVDNTKIINKIIDNSADGLLVSSSNEAGYVLVPKAGIGNYTDIQNLVKTIFVSGRLSDENASIAVLNGTNKNGIAAKVTDSLKGLKLNVVKTGSAENTDYKKTTIYDYSGGTKSATIDYLKNTYKADVQQKSGNGLADIELVLGSNYTDK
jgi:LCP family protein required for cell wall assembly